MAFYLANVNNILLHFDSSGGHGFICGSFTDCVTVPTCKYIAEAIVVYGTILCCIYKPKHSS